MFNDVAQILTLLLAIVAMLFFVPFFVFLIVKSAVAGYYFARRDALEGTHKRLREKIEKNSNN